MALVSPGVEVSVIDESFYTPGAAATVPMVFVATATNKTKASGSGIAQGTLAANAGKPYLVTSQRELGDLFGDALFESDANGNMVHGGELNEYGLNTSYSLLGVSNRAYVVRADLDLSELAASATAPGGEPADGAWWFDTLNTKLGILEWNGAAITTSGGQSFTAVTTKVITETTDLVGNVATGIPKGSVGAIGDFAINAAADSNKLYYKSSGNATGVNAGEWVAVGSNKWMASHATVKGTSRNPTLTNGDEIVLNTVTVTLAGTTIANLASDINGAGITGVSAAAVDGVLEIYGDSTATSNGSDADGKIVVGGGQGSLTGLADSAAGGLGIDNGTYGVPRLTIAPHTSVPTYKTGDTTPAPTGSLWVKTTVPNGGANWRIKQYSTDTQLWNNVSAPLYTSNQAALMSLDKTGGGENLLTDDLYVRVNIDEETPAIANYKIHYRAAVGATSIVSDKIASQLTTGTKAFTIAETIKNSVTLTSKAVSGVVINGTTADADTVAGAINAANFTNIVAYVNAQNRVVIEHKLGGDFRIVDTDGLLNDMGFAGLTANESNKDVATANLYVAPTGDAVHSLVASNWKPLTYTASPAEPLALTSDGQRWYSSTVDDVDIMIHNGTTWVGYQNYNADYADTDPSGPIVSASKPTTQSDTTPLVDGDIWVSTADLENYPLVYRWNGTSSEWVLVDKTDQTTEAGMLFADARWSTSGGSAAGPYAPANINDLLDNDYLDPDAPDPALYPKGMLLWNTRRSGFNVKKFVLNSIDVAGSNQRFEVDDPQSADPADVIDQPMASYYPHRWVTDSGNNADGSGTFGRHAQRKSVVQALQALVNSNQDIRDEESRQFNLMATPGYPELIGEMVTLNYDRRLTAFVVGDTPLRLTPDATSLNEWANNVRGALEDNDLGGVSKDEYLGMYYPAGFSSDNFGNNVVVPASHMALRTLVLNDQVAFPWFAPAGTRRGGVTNASSSGYINAEGEFIGVALNTGQRDTLYSAQINPITFISGAGLVVFGQKTRARNASALDRVNVARLVVYLRGQLELLARPYLFEPNDKITRDQIKSAADQLLIELVGLRALYDFLVVCDESNNTPARVDRNELYLDIAIEPVKAIEFIYIPLRLKNTGEIAALG